MKNTLSPHRVWADAHGGMDYCFFQFSVSFIIIKKMKDYYYGCTGGCFDSPIHWYDIYGWQTSMFYHPSEWYDKEDSEASSKVEVNSPIFRMPSDQYWIYPDNKIKESSSVSCFSCMFEIFRCLPFTK